MSFNDIIGHEKIINYLKKSIENSNIGHAYIFEGPSGVGKTLTAINYAKGILCKNFQLDSCERCSSCVKINSNNHADFRFIESQEKSIKNTQIESIQQDLLRRPNESEKMVYIINKAATMTISAQNRFLKTLEEPSKYAVIILLTENANSLLPTIKSRCQILKFSPISLNMIEQYLVEKYLVDEDNAKILSIFSCGIIGKAIKLYNSKDFKEKRERSINIVEKIINNNIIDMFDTIEYFTSYKDEIEEILDMLIYVYRDILITGTTSLEDMIINVDKKEFIKSCLQKIEYTRIGEIINLIEKTKKDIRANINFQLAIENMLLKIQDSVNSY